MTTAIRYHGRFDGHAAPLWLPAIALPLIVGWAGAHWPTVALAWALAVAIYAVLKWLTWSINPTAQQASRAQSLQYLLLWPGMDAQAFFDASPPVAGKAREWFGAVAKVFVGLALIYGVSPLVVRSNPLVAAWAGVVGIALCLLYGTVQLLSLLWRSLGVNALPIMKRPLAAKSLSDFWSNRWNLAFRDAARVTIFQPLVGRLGLARATMAVFAGSGIVHDAVMSLPVKAGIGLPTLYFLIQGAAVLFERSRAGRWLGLGRGIKGRAFAVAVVLGPVGLLFHRAFLEGVILPTLNALAAV